jgi:hypothetical protein
MKTILFYVLFSAASLTMSVAWSGEVHVRCNVEYGGKTVHVEVRPTDDVYAMTTTDVLSPFRFSAQYLAERGKLKTYVYHDAKNRYVLIHAAEYTLTQAHCSQHQSDFGLHKVYSARMEKELFMQCLAHCDQ